MRSRLGAVAAFAVFTLSIGAPARAQASQERDIQGTVYDSLAAAPMASVPVILLDRGNQAAAQRSVKTDSSGHFRFAGVGPGTYLLGFDAPVLDSLGIGSPTRVVRIAASSPASVSVNLGVPGGLAVHNAFCPGRDPHDSTSALVGHLTDASTRGVISGGTVQVSWIGVAKRTHDVDVHRITAEAQSGNDGWFALCDLPAGMPVAVVAFAGPDTSALVNLLIPETRGLVRLEMYLRNAQAAHSASLSGTVNDQTTHRPIGGARVEAEESKTTAAPDGRFTLHDLPYGTVLVTATAKGYQPTQQQTNVVAGDSTRVTLSLLSNAMMSDTARATAAAAVADKNGFNARMKKWPGMFYSYEDLKKLRVNHTSDLVVGGRLLAIDTGSAPGWALQFRNKLTRCDVTFYVDGLLARDIRSALDLDADVPWASLAAVEVYPGMTPPEFPERAASGGAQNCGLFVLWRLPRPLWAGGDGH